MQVVFRLSTLLVIDTYSGWSIRALGAFGLRFGSLVLKCLHGKVR